MAKRQQSNRREYLTVEGFNPEDSGTCEILLSYNRIQAVGRRGLGFAKECGYTLPMILQNPTAVFEGLRRGSDEDRLPNDDSGWRCYCGRPSVAYDGNGKEMPPWPDEVFLVFVSAEKVAYNWRWEKCDPDNPELPLDHSVGEDEPGTRFRRRLC